MSRQIEGLLWARTSERPAGLPRPRLRGAKLAGLRYEGRVAEALPEALHGQWFAFLDRNGPGYCQPDLLLGRSGTCFVLEVKYSWTLEGHQQIEGLYLPVLQKAIERPVAGLVVCRRLVSGMGRVRVTGDLSEALAGAKRGERMVWHWLGTSAVQDLEARRAA